MNERGYKLHSNNKCDAFSSLTEHFKLNKKMQENKQRIICKNEREFKMKKYLKNLLYIIEHKRNVFIEGRKLGLGIWQLLMHDMSKLTKSEFSQYANSFFGGERTDVIKNKFSVAWLNHKHKNKHHWQYWIDIKNKEIFPLEMPMKYIQEMLADWNSMSRKFHPLKNRIEATKEWYDKQIDIILHPTTKTIVESYLNNRWTKLDKGYAINMGTLNIKKEKGLYKKILDGDIEIKEYKTLTREEMETSLKKYLQFANQK